MANSKNRDDHGKNEKTNEREGNTGRTSSQGRKKSSGGGKAKKGNPETHKNINARKIE
jgi:hypothetical protein